MNCSMNCLDLFLDLETQLLQAGGGLDTNVNDEKSRTSRRC